MNAPLAIFLGFMFGVGFLATLAAALGSWVAAWVVRQILLGRR